MRLAPCALAALAALGLPLGAVAQLAAPAKAPQAFLAGCRWQPLGSFPQLVPRALATTADGALLLAGEQTGVAGGSVLVTWRLPASGGWQEVDRYLPAGASQSGARALHVDADGNAFVLAWEQRGDGSRLTLRRSFGGGAAGSWESAETHWPLLPGGALASDPDGRLYVAYGIAGPGGVGWRVESALRGLGAFAPEDELVIAGVYGAIPQDRERTGDGTLVLAAQLDGAPDQWLVRARPPRQRGKPGDWRTLDRFQLSADAYGLAPRAVVATADGRLLVAGLGVRGGDRHDYQWLVRWRNARGRWKTSTYQLAGGLTSLAQDAAATRGGVAVLGIGMTAAGTSLVLRESTNGGSRWQTALRVEGVTDLWSARLAVDGNSAAVTASIGGAAVVIGCNR